MANTKVTFKSITINRLVDIYDDKEQPQPAYEFGQGHSIFTFPEKPGVDYSAKQRRYIRERDLYQRDRHKSLI